MILNAMPKTRSGKCLRRSLKAIVRGKKPGEYPISPTIADASVFAHIHEVVDAMPAELGLGKNAKQLEYVDVEGEMKE